MMENITLGQIGLAVTFLVGLIGGITYLKNNFESWIQTALKEPLDSIRDDIKKLSDRLNEVERESTKNFLVARLSEVEKGEAWDEIETERFWEQYQRYIDAGGNTYIKEKVEKLKARGAI